MQASAVIFDMDGLLVDSEPLWKEAADELLASYSVRLSLEEYEKTTGLRTKEFLEWWFDAYHLPLADLSAAEEKIIHTVLEKVKAGGKAMMGVPQILEFFRQRGYKIGLASSSPLYLINEVIAYLGIGGYFDAVCSAGELPYGKPHPQVYLNCLEALGSKPSECLCFEDSFNGMIAAKAAKLKCVVVPAKHQYNQPRWAAADLKISSLLNFNELLLDSL